MIVEAMDSGSKLKVFRGDRGFIVTYQRYLDNDRVMGLKDLVMDGLPRNWINYNPAEDCQGLIYFSRGFTPPFVAKIKAHTDVEHISKVKELTDAECRQKTGIGKENALAATSVLNEMSLAPYLSLICQDEEAKDLVSQYGYREIQYVPPVLGFVGRDGRKIVYYNMVNGLFLGESANPRPLSKPIQYSLVEDLGEYFAQMGIEAGDLAPRQLQVDHNQSTLYLFDAEAYVRIPQIQRPMLLAQAA